MEKKEELLLELRSPFYAHRNAIDHDKSPTKLSWYSMDKSLSKVEIYSKKCLPSFFLTARSHFTIISGAIEMGLFDDKVYFGNLLQQLNKDGFSFTTVITEKKCSNKKFVF